MVCVLTVSCVAIPASAAQVSAPRYDDTTEKPTCWKCKTQGVFVRSWTEYDYYYTRVYSEFTCPNDECEVVSWVMSVDINNITGEEEDEYEVVSVVIDPYFDDVIVEQ